MCRIARHRHIEECALFSAIYLRSLSVLNIVSIRSWVFHVEVLLSGMFPFFFVLSVRSASVCL